MSPQPSKFYSVSIAGQCEKCSARATEEIRGPFNAKYTVTCAKHAKQKIAELERAHATTTEFPKS